MESHNKETKLRIWLEKDIKDPTFNQVIENIGHVGASGTLFIIGVSVFMKLNWLGILSGFCIAALGFAFVIFSLTRSIYIALNLLMNHDDEARRVLNLKRKTMHFLKMYPKQFMGSIVYIFCITISLIVLCFKVASMAKPF